jgi:hypothetical protein
MRRHARRRYRSRRESRHKNNTNNMAATNVAFMEYTSATTAWLHRSGLTAKAAAPAIAGTTRFVRRYPAPNRKPTARAAWTAENRFTRYATSPTGRYVNKLPSSVYVG